MKKSLVLAMAMALGVTASAYAANPFSDVPAGHWAYDSISKLAAAGVIEGYGDDTFRGDHLMTRYEMAQIVARAMAKGANVDKLAAEFADELDKLGVRVAALETKADNVMITGQIRYHYESRKQGNNKTYGSAFRTRLWFAGKVNDNWTYRGRLQNVQNLANNASDDRNVQLNRAYLDGRLGGTSTQFGRAPLYVGEGNVYDAAIDGVIVKYGKKVKVGAWYGKPTDANGNAGTMNRAWGANLGFELGKKVNLALEYSDFHNGAGADNLKIFDANLRAKLTDKFGLGAMYIHTDSDNVAYIPANGSKNGFVVSAEYGGASFAKKGSWGIEAKYYHTPAGAAQAHTMDPNVGNDHWLNGMKGYSIIGRYTLAKNMMAEIEWFDVKDRGNDQKDKSLWTAMQIRF